MISDANPAEDLHLLLDTPGGDGETAIRLVRSAQARCRELTVIVPNQAKSAGTILAIGAHWIIMGPASDLGPVDPQFMDPSRTGALYSAKDLIAAVDAAEKAITKNTVNGHRFLPTGGHLIPHWWPSFLPAGGHLRTTTCVGPTVTA